MYNLENCHALLGEELEVAVSNALDNYPDGDVGILTTEVNNAWALSNSMISIVFRASGYGYVSIVPALCHREDINEQAGIEIVQDYYDDLHHRVSMVLTMMRGEPMYQDTLQRIYNGTLEVTTGWLEDLGISESIPYLPTVVACTNNEGDLANAIIIKN